MPKLENFFNSISIKKKIAGILLFFLLIFLVLFMSVTRVLNDTNQDIDEISKLYKLKSSIFELNKDISETQRLVLAFGRTGSDAIYERLGNNNNEVKYALQTLRGKVSRPRIKEILQSLISVSSRYDDNIISLGKLRRRKELFTNKNLPRAESQLEEEILLVPLIDSKKNRFQKYLYKIAFYAQNYFSTKNYKSKRSLYNLIEIFDKEIPDNLIILKTSLKRYKDTFDQTNIAVRNYTTLVNVVMSGEATEFSILSKELTTEVRALTEEKRKIIKKEVESNAERFLIAFLLLLPFVFITVYYSNKYISNALVKISQTFDQFLRQDFSAEVPERNRGDEIGRLASAAEEFKKLNKSLQSEKLNAQKLAKTKTDFLANMSHEIRTPMNGILGMVEHLQETPVSQEQKEMLEVINSCGTSLYTILNDILDLSKIESGKMTFESRPISLNAIVKEIEFLFKETAENKGIFLKSSIQGENLPNYFIGDITRIKQILINLMSNSIKFTKEGGIDFNVTGAVKDKNSVELTFSIKDTGIGIPLDKQAHIFQEFSQSDTSITREFGGTGLGLSISKKLVELMGSELNLSSEVGKGSEFSFTLVCKMLDDEFTEEDDVANSSDLTFPQLHCLVVEDNEINIKVLTRRLDKYKISYEIAHNGQEAMEKEKNGGIHFILMDMQMPVMDGLTATRLLRQRGCRIPIVAMTANVQSVDRAACKDAGMDYFIGKPIDKDLLENILTQISKVIQ